MAELLLSLGALDNEAAPSEERDACALAKALSCVKKGTKVGNFIA